MEVLQNIYEDLPDLRKRPSKRTRNPSMPQKEILNGPQCCFQLFQIADCMIPNFIAAEAQKVFLKEQICSTPTLVFLMPRFLSLPYNHRPSKAKRALQISRSAFNWKQLKAIACLPKNPLRVFKRLPRKCKKYLTIFQILQPPCHIQGWTKLQKSTAGKKVLSRIQVIWIYGL